MATWASKVLSRFDDSVEKIPESGCWIFGQVNEVHGYGIFSVVGKTYRAHRWAYEHFVGPIPDDLVVRHTCDVKCCVNPYHLILGSQQENIADKMRKGRQARGSRQGSSKLSEADLPLIREHLKGYRVGMYSELGRKFGVHRAIIARIHSGEIWKHA
jgi:hypothetical protein